MHFDTKLGHVTHAKRWIPYACTLCTSIIYQPWIPGLTEQQQLCYQPVKYWTSWPALGYFNNWNIIKLSHKATSSEWIDKIHQVVKYIIIENKAELVNTDKYGYFNKTDTTTTGYYVIKFMSEPYTLQ